MKQMSLVGRLSTRVIQRKMASQQQIRSVIDDAIRSLTSILIIQAPGRLLRLSTN